MIVRLYKGLNGSVPKFKSLVAFRRLHTKDVIPPIKKYSTMLEKGILKPDKYQFEAVLKIQDLYNDLREYNPWEVKEVEEGEKSDEGDVTEATTKITKKGLYLYGGVGCGKTLLLDLLYDSMPTTHKKRVHFNSFMLYLYSEMNRWNLCLEDEVDLLTPSQHLANKIMQDTWLLCFDEIQLADYASCALLDGVFNHMLAKGAVIVATSNRPPQDLGDLSITDSYEGETESVQQTVRSFKSIFTDNCHLHNLSSERDHRAEMNLGESRYLYPRSVESDEKLDIMFSNAIPPKTKITSSTVELYGRKVLIPLSAGPIARFSFQELCCRPLGPADYIKICNTFRSIFIDHIPKLNMNTRNEARRLLSFIDAAYESRVQLYCTADTSPDDLFLILPRNDGNYDMEQMHMEMIGAIAYDLKIHGMDFRSLNIISGEDEIFSFKRAISRLKEMQSSFYQSTVHRPQVFLPYMGTKEEIENAEEKRRLREQQRQHKLNELNESDSSEVGELGMDNERLYKDTDWGDEASYLTLSKETSELAAKKKRTSSGRRSEVPKFGDQHFWGFGWWENVKQKFKPSKDK